VKFSLKKFFVTYIEVNFITFFFKEKNKKQNRFQKTGPPHF